MWLSTVCTFILYVTDCFMFTSTVCGVPLYLGCYCMWRSTYVGCYCCGVVMLCALPFYVALFFMWRHHTLPLKAFCFMGNSTICEILLYVEFYVCGGLLYVVLYCICSTLSYFMWISTPCGDLLCVVSHSIYRCSVGI